MMTSFEELEVRHIPREENTQVNILSNLASDKGKGKLSSVIRQSLIEGTVKLEEFISTKTISPEWLTTMKKVVED